MLTQVLVWIGSACSDLIIVKARVSLVENRHPERMQHTVNNSNPAPYGTKVSWCKSTTFCQQKCLFIPPGKPCLDWPSLAETGSCKTSLAEVSQESYNLRNRHPPDCTWHMLVTSNGDLSIVHGAKLDTVGGSCTNCNTFECKKQCSSPWLCMSWRSKGCAFHLCWTIRYL